MKAILVLDEMPENCIKCRFSDFGRCLCSALYIRLSVNGRPKECPLRPLPQKNKYDVEKYATVDYENDITLEHYLNKGWNDCLDTIMGSNMAHRWEKE